MEGSASAGDGAPGLKRSRRRRRRRARGPEAGADGPSARSSEDIVRAPAREAPARLTRPPDGTTLEQVIGELQSDWGVPQNPQEFRITLKVADEKTRSGRQAVVEERSDPEDTEELQEPIIEGEPERKIRREKAPAPPQIGVETSTETRRAKRRRRSRRRRKSGKSGG